jgi:hypothetical protein
MQLVLDPPEAGGHEPSPDEEPRAARDETRHRRDAVSFLEAAATAEDEATRQSLRHRAAELVSPHRRGQK